MSLPSLPAEGETNWFDKRNAFDQAVKTLLENVHPEALSALMRQVHTLGKAVYESPNNRVLSDDIPVITTISRNFWEESTIPDTEGWWREKRVGASEPAVGTWPSATSVPDLTGSSYFRYPGTVDAEASGTSPSDLITAGPVPGGAGVYAYWPLNVEFVTESPVIDIRAFTAVAGGNFARILVDGKPVSDRNYKNTSGSAGVGIVVRLEFSEPRERKISLYGISGGFGGVAVADGYTVRRSFAPRRRVAIIGDSWVGGAGSGAESVHPTETFAFELALRMGADSILWGAIGGTGYVKALSGQPTSIFAGRVEDILATRPDVVVIAGGRNDYDVTSTLRQAVADLLASLDDIPEVYVVPTGSETSAARQLIALGAEDADRLYIDFPVDSIEKITDGVHPTWEGHQELADVAYNAINPVDIITRDELDDVLGSLIIRLGPTDPIPEGTPANRIIVQTAE